MKIIGISGSLKAASVNTAILRAMADICPSDCSFTIWDGLGALPHFSPDIDFDHSPGAVISYRALLKESDAIVICTPEYAFGMPGVLKNALDWAVSSGEFDRKPVATVSASPLTSGGEKALAWLKQTLTALGAHQVDGASMSIPAVKGKQNAAGELVDAATLDNLKNVLDSLVAVV
jgi:NAD(P)H-dependent FMN reductase